MTEFNKFNYIGSKYKLFPDILSIIYEKIGTNDISGMTVGDLFSGTGICSYNFRILGANVISNDYEYYGYVIAQAFSCSVITDNIIKKIENLNKLTPISGIIHKNYGSERMFFTEKNAMKIDSMRISLEKYKKNDEINLNEYYYLLTCIMLAADKVANITSVYGAFLKQFKASALKDIEVKHLHLISKKNKKNLVHNKNINDLVESDNQIYDIVYLDPPYNSRQYSKNYHVLNYIAMYKDIEIKGITGLLVNSNISSYCRKGEVAAEFENLFACIKSKWLFMSYNSESLLSKKEIMKIMIKYGKVDCTEKVYKRFKSNSNGTQKETVIEYIFFLEYFKEKEEEEEEEISKLVNKLKI